MKRKSSADAASTLPQLQQQLRDEDSREPKRCKTTPPSSQSSLLQRSNDIGQPASSSSAIEDWLDSVSESSNGIHDAALMATISDTASSSTRPLRSPATSRSRSSSPSKLTPQNYRAQVLQRVNIHIDVDASDGLRNQLLPPTAPSNSIVETVAEDLYKGARELLDRQTANEAEWVGLLNGAIHGLIRERLDQLCCLPNRDWQAVLKPIAYSHKVTSILPQKRQTSISSPANISHPLHPAYPSPDHSTSTTFANQPHMPPPVQTLQLEPAPARLQPRTPRPDLCVGLSDSEASWGADQELWLNTGVRGQDIKEILADLQAASNEIDATGALISDPCTASPSGMRFPFLIIEVKSGGSTSIADAENQSAVSGACALSILRALSGEERTSFPELGPHNPVGMVDSGSERRSLPLHTSCFKLRTFSLTTEGPAHALWAHFHDSAGYSMVWLGAYRVTNRDSAVELVRMLANILAWGATELKRWVGENILRILTTPALV